MIANEKSYTLIDFFATWCSPCQTMEPIITRIEKQFENELQVLRVDVDKYEQFAQYFKIQNVPTFILLDGDKVIWKQAGIIPFKDMEKAISECI